MLSVQSRRVELKVNLMGVLKSLLKPLFQDSRDDLFK
jgi:hypothetical protein